MSSIFETNVQALPKQLTLSTRQVRFLLPRLDAGKSLKVAQGRMDMCSTKLLRFWGLDICPAKYLLPAVSTGATDIYRRLEESLSWTSVLCALCRCQQVLLRSVLPTSSSAINRLQNAPRKILGSLQCRTHSTPQARLAILDSLSISFLRSSAKSPN